MKFNKLVISLATVGLLTTVSLANTQQVKAISSEEGTVTVNMNTEKFIETIGEKARKIAADNNLYGSVLVAQAVHESENGNSFLSYRDNNLFGIKGYYKGKAAVYVTNEDDGSGKMHQVYAAFRKYDNFEQSLQDYADLIKYGLDTNPYFYSGAWKENAKTPYDVTRFLTRRYATDIHYAEKLDFYIKKYGLEEYDITPKEKEEIKLKEQMKKNQEYAMTVFHKNIEILDGLMIK